MFIKIHESYRKVVALCDADIVGKVFEEGKMQLDVRENFYVGEKVEAEKAIALLQSLYKDDATFNIVGEKAVEIAREAGVIHEGNIGKVDGVPFALVLI